MDVILRWRHNDHAGVSNHQPHGCLLNRLFRRKSKNTSKLRVTGLCAGNSTGTGEFPAQMASYAENVSIWRRHHGIQYVSISRPILDKINPILQTIKRQRHQSWMEISWLTFHRNCHHAWHRERDILLSEPMSIQIYCAIPWGIPYVTFEIWKQLVHERPVY